MLYFFYQEVDWLRKIVCYPCHYAKMEIPAKERPTANFCL